MDTQTYILAVGAFFIAAFLKGLTGLGFSTLCLGFLALFIDLKLAVPLVFLPSLSSNLLVMIDAGHFVAGLRRFWLLYLSALPGLAVGIRVLAGNRNAAPKAILGAVMLIYGLWGLQGGTVRLSATAEKRLLLPVGLVSGVLNGATGSQIMPIMPYLLSLDIDRNLFIQTINCAFTVNTLVMIAALGTLGMLTLPLLCLSAAGILPVALGIFLGGQIRKRVTEEIYRKIVLMLLMGIGISLTTRFLF
jgi:uncharacterized membrane protein YfcA